LNNADANSPENVLYLTHLKYIPTAEKGIVNAVFSKEYVISIYKIPFLLNKTEHQSCHVPVYGFTSHSSHKTTLFIAESDCCPLGTETQDVIHLFIDCPYVKLFLANFQTIVVS
jgi:hypothetical protein